MKSSKKTKAIFKATEGYLDTSIYFRLGPMTSYSLLCDPKHLCFVLARYKFCSKLLAGKKNVFEIGCGDAFGTPIVAQVVEHLYSTDWDEKMIEDNRERLAGFVKNVEFQAFDITKKVPSQKFDAIFSTDVIEHIKPSLTKKFMKNSTSCLDKDGIYIMGTPNINAKKYESHQSLSQHINMLNHEKLRKLLQHYFKNVFLFSMNDEVVHTGFYPMAHYLFGVGIGLK